MEPRGRDRDSPEGQAVLLAVEDMFKSYNFRLAWSVAVGSGRWDDHIGKAAQRGAHVVEYTTTPTCCWMAYEGGTVVATLDSC